MQPGPRAILVGGFLAACTPPTAPVREPAAPGRCEQARTALEQALAAVTSDGATAVRKAAEASDLADAEALASGTRCDFEQVDANVMQLQGFAALGHEQLMAQYLPLRASDCSARYADTCKRVAADLAGRYRFSITGSPDGEMRYSTLWTDRPFASDLPEHRTSAEWLHYVAHAKGRSGAVGFVSFTVTGSVAKGSEVVVTGRSAASSLPAEVCQDPVAAELPWLVHPCKKKVGVLPGAEISAVVSAEDWARIGQPYRSEPGIASSDDGKIKIGLRVELAQLREVGANKFTFGRAVAPRELPEDLQPFTPLARRWAKSPTAIRDSASHKE